MAAAPLIEVGDALYGVASTAVTEAAKNIYHRAQESANNQVVEYIQEGAQKIEEIGKRAYHKTQSKFNQLIHGKSWKRRRIMPAAFTQTLEPIESTPRPLQSNDMAPFELKEIGKLAIPLKLKYSKMGYYRRRRRRRFGRKRRKLASKTYVKRAIGIRAGMDGPQFKTLTGSTYVGNVSGTTPTPLYGKIHRQDIVFFTRLTTLNHMSQADSMFQAKNPLTGNLPDQFKYMFKKLRFKFELHNPMNEVVKAKIWWIKYKQDSAEEPVGEWKVNYEREDEPNASPVAFDENIFEYPTRHHEWTKTFKIVKKYETIFRPGETKKLSCRGMGFNVHRNDINHPTSESNRKHGSHALMFELCGVPTHQHDTTANPAQTNAINYSPAALDMIWSYSFLVYRSGSANGLHYSVNDRDTVSRAQSMTNVQAQDYAPF